MHTSLILLLEKIHYSGAKFLLVIIAGLYLENTIFLEQIARYSIIIGFFTICHFGLDSIISYKLSKQLLIPGLFKIRLIGSVFSSITLISLGILDSIYSIIFVSISLLGVAVSYEQLKALGTGDKEKIIKYRIYPEIFSFTYRIFFLFYFIYIEDYSNEFFYFLFFTTEFAYGVIAIYANLKKPFIFSSQLGLRKDLSKTNIDLIIKGTLLISAIYYFQRSDVLISNLLNEESNIKKITFFQQLFDSAGVLALALIPIINKMGEISNKLINQILLILLIVFIIIIYLTNLNVNLGLILIGFFSLATGLASYTIIHILQIKNKINFAILSLVIASAFRTISFFLVHHNVYTFEIHMITTYLETLFILLFTFKKNNHSENI